MLSGNLVPTWLGVIRVGDWDPSSVRTSYKEEFGGVSPGPGGFLSSGIG